MKNHLWMLAACLLPLVLLFALSSMGVQSDPFFALLLIVCFAVHLWMMKTHDRRDKEKGGRDDEQD